ncbi:MAG: hypothetical protein JSV19_06990 [Phycisphaerales bacterium]|nr:MAG: hypothetical protein JSV19_06990 [Phycisphaerales bacterium]
MPSEESAGSAGDELIVVQLHFDVMRVELPIDPVRHSAKIWNHVDELQVDPQQCALLGRNGLRIGVASADAWPAIEAVLDAHHARSTRRQHAVQSGYPLTLDVGGVEGGETIFSYDGQGNLAGTTFGGGRKYIHVDYAVSADNSGRITLKVLPEVHAESTRKRWETAGGVFQEQASYEGRVYRELAASVRLSPGRFLVIGPSPQADIGYLLGSRFLEREAGGTRYETLLFATPQLFRTGP